MTRKKVVIQARELSDMDVNIISLVKRGANRIPFRIVKSDGESTMNISNLFVWKQEPEPVVASVIAVVLAKTADQELYTKALAKGGFEVDHVTEGENDITLMFTKSDEMEDAVALKISDDAAVVISGVEKGLLAFPDSNSFIENITKAGFAPSYRIANDILTETVGNIIFSEGDAEETKGQVQKAIEDFGGYIDAILSTIPVQAFKAEEILTEVLKGLLNAPKKAPKKASKKKPAKEKTSESKQDDENGDEEDDAVSEDDSGADDSGADESGDDESGDDESGDDDAEGSEDESEEVSKDPEGTEDKDKDDAIAAMTKSLTGIVDGLAELKTSQTDALKVLSDRMTDLEAKVKKTDEALAGTTSSSDTDDNSDDGKPKADKVVKWDNILNFGDVELY